MKAILYRKYGPPEVLHLEDVAKPVPKNEEILIKIRATTVSAADWRMRKAEPFIVRMFNGLFRPKKNILGLEFSGEVEEVGQNVTRFKKGDQVFAYAGDGFGGYAEYRCLPENGNHECGIVALKPAGLNDQDAAAVPLGGLTALAFLRDRGKIQKKQSVLIYGASGSVGTYAVQLAKYFGAEVTAVCSTANIAMVQDLGADTVVDYIKEDFTERGQSYDIIFDVVTKCSRARAKKCLKPGGIFFTTFERIKFRPEDLDFLKELCESGQLKPVIDRIYSLDAIIDAHRYVEQFHKKGNVVVNID